MDSHQTLRLGVLALLFNLGTSDYISDLIVVEGEDAVAPYGYTIIPVDLNGGTKGKYLYFAVNKAHSTQNAIRDIVVVTGNSPAIKAPPSYVRILTDLNWGSGGAYIYAAYSYDPSKGNAIVDVDVLSCGENDVHCHCRGAYAHKIPVDLNKGAGGKFIYLCYQRS